MKKAMTFAAIGMALLLGGAGMARAETFKVEATMTPKEQMKLDFKDGTGHFFLMVRREGKAEGSGPLAGAGILHIKAVSPSDRRFSLEGELVQSP
ncbi:MAG: hypothetical protein WCJ64_04005 [Rhodospirillaceae bacterium]